GTAQTTYPYALARLVYCAHCEAEAQRQNNPALRSRLGGTNQYGKRRYRHYGGVTCGCNTRSVPIEIIEAEFRQLIALLTIDPDALDLLTELAIQSEHGNGSKIEKDDLEQTKNAAIAKCRRRIEAARSVFLDGDMTREEYLSIKEQNEREIAHWEARTTETEKAAIELQMCMNAINQMVELWDGCSDEDRQEM